MCQCCGSIYGAGPIGVILSDQDPTYSTENLHRFSYFKVVHFVVYADFISLEKLDNFVKNKFCFNTKTFANPKFGR